MTCSGIILVLILLAHCCVADATAYVAPTSLDALSKYATPAAATAVATHKSAGRVINAPHFSAPLTGMLNVSRSLYTGATLSSYWSTTLSPSTSCSASSSCVMWSDVDATGKTTAPLSVTVDSQDSAQYRTNTVYFTGIRPAAAAQQVVLSFNLVGIAVGDTITVWALSPAYLSTSSQTIVDARWCLSAVADGINSMVMLNPFDSDVLKIPPSSGSCLSCSYTADGSNCGAATCAANGIVHLDNLFNYDFGQDYHRVWDYTGDFKFSLPYNWSAAVCLKSGASGVSSGYRLQAATWTCPAGNSCPDGAYWPTECTAQPGFGCPANHATTVAPPCPVGSYCPGGTPAMVLPCSQPWACQLPQLSAPVCNWGLSTLAGKNNGAVSGSVDALGSSAQFASPQGAYTSGNGTLYVVDFSSSTVRQVSSEGRVSTIAGSQPSGFVDDIGTAAKFKGPTSITGDGYGSLYVLDTSNHAVRSLNLATLRVTTVIGTGLGGYADGVGTIAQIYKPTDLVFDPANTIGYLCEGNRIRLVQLDVFPSPTTFVLTTIAGSSTANTAGQGGLGYLDDSGTNALFNQPVSLAFSSIWAALYVADFGNNRVRLVYTGDGTYPVSTIAGASAGYIDGVGTQAKFYAPSGLALNAAQSHLYVAESTGARIRSIYLYTFEVITLSGTGSIGTDDGYGTLGAFQSVRHLAIDSQDTLFLPDASNNNVRKLACLPCPPGNATCQSSNSPAPTSSKSFTRTPSSTTYFCSSSSNTPSSTKTRSSNSPSTTKTRSLTPTGTPSVTPSPTCTPSLTSSLSSTPTGTPSATSSPSYTPSPTSSLSSTTSATPSPTYTPSATASFSSTLTGTPSATPTPTFTPSVTASFSPTQTDTSSATRSPTPSATPLTCAPGTFVAPGTYTCARCPLGFFSAATGPITSCASCSPQVSSPNATSCINCPALQRSNGTGLCEACPLGRFCDGTGTDLPCLPPIDVCAGALQGCRAGHSGFLCSACAQGFFMSPSSYCSPCTNSFFTALPAVLASAIIVPLFYWAVRSDLQYLTTYLAQLRLVLSKYDITITVLSDHLLRLSLLKRVASLQLPSLFGWLTGFVSLVFGFNIMGSGAECVDPTWSFTKTFATVFGVGATLTAATLLWDLSTFNRGNGVTINKWSWRVWDTLAFCLPFAVQTSWEALTHLNVNGQERLWGAPTIPWEIFSATSVIAALTIALQVFFILFRFLLPCSLTVERSIDASGHELVRPVDKPKVSSDPSAFSVLDLYSTPAARLGFVRNVMAFLRSAAIPLQMSSTLAPAAWLISLSAVELALAFVSRKALVEELAMLRVVEPVHGVTPPAASSKSWQAAAWLFILAVFTITHVCAIFCAASSSCTSLTGLGVFLIFLNTLPFVLFIFFILRKSCSAAANNIPTQVFPSEGMTPLPTASRRHMLVLDHGKPVLLNEPRQAPLPTTAPDSSLPGLSLRGGQETGDGVQHSDEKPTDSAIADTT